MKLALLFALLAFQADAQTPSLTFEARNITQNSAFSTGPIAANPNDDVEMRWNATGVTYCAGNWQSRFLAINSQDVYSVTTSRDLTLSCGIGPTPLVTATIRVIVGQGNLPTIRISQVVNGASFLQGPIVPCAWATAYGSGLAPSPAVPPPGGLVQSLNQTELRVNGIAAYLQYVSPVQINFQVPCELNAGRPFVISVATAGGRSPDFPAAASRVWPGLFNYAETLGGPAKVIVQEAITGNRVTEMQRVRPGTFLTVYGTGFGSTDPTIASNQPGPFPLLARHTGSLAISFSGYLIPTEMIAYVGLVPGIVGVTQINFRIPESAPDGAVRVNMVYGGVPVQPEFSLTIGR